MRNQQRSTLASSSKGWCRVTAGYKIYLHQHQSCNKIYMKSTTTLYSSQFSVDNQMHEQECGEVSFSSAQICNRLVFYVPLQPTFISVIAAPEIEIFGFEQWHALFTSESAISSDILIVGKNHFQTNTIGIVRKLHDCMSV